MTDNTYPFEWRGRIAPDPLSLDDFEITTPSGATIYPHKGETVWCRVYGAPMTQDTAELRRVGSEFQSAVAGSDPGAVDAAGIRLTGFVLTRAVGWNITDPETGDPYPQPTAGAEAVYGALPGALLLWLFFRLAGMEAPSDRGKGSSGSPSGPSTKTARKSPPRPR